jgi:hypothetical protein
MPSNPEEHYPEMVKAILVELRAIRRALEKQPPKKETR